ncbi:MAG: DUF4113 domain-containing protein, partial [Alcaligenaceae bacterium]|nr:DUF4113 domain-containing protein [Alcaligenaceae bacterium]
AGGLLYPSNDTREFNRLALQLLKRIWRNGYRYNKAGVMLSDFYSDQQYQTELFDSEVQNSRGRYLMQTIDNLNYQYPSSIRFASQGLRQDTQWTMQRRYLSPAYTSNWREIPRVR